ncbi:MAG: bifunctional methylenetetrahydrofolate dehydrogenase/methenyltetrahydrofolate cyclohydrolase FolD [candidate division Zixibacteria bacterium]|nr:bifunctional methylenetetrahydrofolate dehydrogenase/methenyltetrahydrofolate cyclohydrolase FolD [candidate division Zixibacteria bacterium]
MSAQIIDGTLVSKQIKDELTAEVAALAQRGIVPGLAAVLVGNDPASEIYVNSKAKACKKLGIYSEVIKRDAAITQSELYQLLDGLNQNPKLSGILLQSPIPNHLDEFAACLRIDPIKDVDGFHPDNVGRLLIGEPRYQSCTPLGVVELLQRYRIELKGKEAVIVGRSNIVGKPLAAMLMQKWPATNATVTVCHSATRDIFAHTRRADVVITALGKPEFLRGENIKEGAVVIDVGINRVEDATAEKGYRVVGDCHFESCAAKAAWITPVPGGVGPMTIAMLLTNTVQAAKLQHGVR